jgi:hypothetical protein
MGKCPAALVYYPGLASGLDPPAAQVLGVYRIGMV